MKNSSNRIAVICPDFFGYPKQIKDSLTQSGYEVRLFDERPSNKVMDKILLRTTGKLFLKKSIERHYNFIISDLQENPVDILFLIDTEAINRSIVKKIKNKINCKVILYMWDSINNKGGFLEYIDLCESAFTFDPEDAKKHQMLKFLPLFYAKQYSKDVDVNDKNIEVSFIGTLHSDRYRVVQTIEKELNTKDTPIKKHIYIQSRLFYYIRKFLNTGLWRSHFHEFSTKRLTTDEVAEIFSRSKVVIDINHPGQIGLTSRTFEALKSGAKLITTNESIKNYKFYDPKMISVINRHDITIDKDFLYSDLCPIDMSQYSLEKWLSIILNTN